jgi:hypothetical protein
MMRARSPGSPHLFMDDERQAAAVSSSATGSAPARARGAGGRAGSWCPDSWPLTTPRLVVTRCAMCTVMAPVSGPAYGTVLELGITAVRSRR